MWPKLQEERSIKKLVLPLLLGITSKDYWLNIFKICFWSAVYISGIQYLQIPFADKNVASQVIQDWWLLDLFDAFFTGFGLSNASIFTLGSLSSFVVSYKIGLKGNSSDIRKITKFEFTYLFVISFLFTIWYFRYGVAASGIMHTIYVFLFILIGGFLCRLISLKLMDLEFGLHCLIGIIILYRFIFENITIGAYLKLWIILGALCLLNCIHFLLIRKSFKSIVWNISGRQFERSAFSFPFIGDKIFINFIYGSVFYSILIYSFLSIIITTIQPPKESSFYVTSIAFLVIFVLFILFRSPELSSIISKFEPTSIAKALKREYWVFDKIRPDDETVQYLSVKYKEITKRTFFYSLFVLVVAVGQWILYQYLRKGDHLFDYGIFGLILLLIATYQIPNIFLKFYYHGKILYSKLKRKYILSSNKELSIINPNPDYSTLNLDEIIINLVDSRFRKDAVRILNSCKTRKDYIKAIVILTKYITKEKELSIAQITLSMIQIFGSVFIFSILVFGATAIALKLFNLNIVLSNKDYYFVMLTFISFWIALSVSIFAWCHPELLKQIKRKLRKN